jgi:hypothetical protein
MEGGICVLPARLSSRRPGLDLVCAIDGVQVVMLGLIRRRAWLEGDRRTKSMCPTTRV